ncbi:MAG: hypothetical protein JNK75_04590 [Betaproteobacteria bacterium]|nr:hypothetical protein [Betaproteobacteria bacterium]
MGHAAGTVASFNQEVALQDQCAQVLRIVGEDLMRQIECAIPLALGARCKGKHREQRQVERTGGREGLEDLQGGAAAPGDEMLDRRPAQLQALVCCSSG